MISNNAINPQVTLSMVEVRCILSDRGLIRISKVLLNVGRASRISEAESRTLGNLTSIYPYVGIPVERDPSQLQRLLSSSILMAKLSFQTERHL